MLLLFIHVILSIFLLSYFPFAISICLFCYAASNVYIRKQVESFSKYIEQVQLAIIYYVVRTIFVLTHSHGSYNFLNCLIKFFFSHNVHSVVIKYIDIDRNRITDLEILMSEDAQTVFKGGRGSIIP